MTKKKENRTIQLSVQLDQPMYDFMERKAKLENVKFQPAKEFYNLARFAMDANLKEHELVFNEILSLEKYEKELSERGKAIEDMLLVVTQLKKLGKKIELVDIEK